MEKTVVMIPNIETYKEQARELKIPLETILQDAGATQEGAICAVDGSHIRARDDSGKLRDVVLAGMSCNHATLTGSGKEVVVGTAEFGAYGVSDEHEGRKLQHDEVEKIAISLFQRAGLLDGIKLILNDNKQVVDGLKKKGMNIAWSSEKDPMLISACEECQDMKNKANLIKEADGLARMAWLKEILKRKVE